MVNKFLNSVEISAQEAVSIIIQLPGQKSFQSVVVVNASPPGDRAELQKPMSEIERMPNDCEEVQ